MAYEDDIKAELALSWVGRSRRKWLEKELARIQGAPKADAPQIVADAPQPRLAAPAMPGDQIVIEGEPAFIRATEEALRLLQGTPSWVLAAKLRGIRQVSAAHIGNSEVGGYLKDGIFHCGDVWRADAKQYASGIVHEGAHAANPRAGGTEGEKIALKAQAQALRELGASAYLIDHYEQNARNPTHHLGWKGASRAA